MKAKLLAVLIFSLPFCTLAADGYTQSDRDRAIRTEITLQEFMKSTEKRFEAVDKQFAAVDKRFEDMNNRLEDMNNRLQDTNNRLQDLNQFMLIMIGIFATVAGGIFIYVIWDRKTFMTVSLQNAREMVDEKLATVQKEGKLNDLVKAMRDLAQDDPKVKTVLSRFNLL